MNKVKTNKVKHNKVKPNKLKITILTIISIFAFIILLGEIEELTFKIVVLKIICIFWLWLIAKRNNYFYVGD